jgi:hypothetical protein
VKPIRCTDMSNRRSVWARVGCGVKRAIDVPCECGVWETVSAADWIMPVSGRLFLQLQSHVGQMHDSLAAMCTRALDVDTMREI